jgi:ubiquitin carboxyl-terminal hydrolase 7
MESEILDSKNMVTDDPEEDVSSHVMRWRVPNYIKIPENTNMYSESYVFDKYEWRFLLVRQSYPVGSFNIYIDVANAEKLPRGWMRKCKFEISILCHREDSKSIRREGMHIFSMHERDRGFVFNKEIEYPQEGFLIAPEYTDIEIEGKITVIKDLSEAMETDEVIDHYNYDSKKETGFVGIRNQGATCYLNSLIQALFHIPFLRRQVYKMETEENLSMPMALQRLFLQDAVW